ncbi:glycosyltransferase family 2 protein [Paenibacillus graminis]|uniref:glycosyltransferase family 2 protein n=1 Tax=Paenibacillus graminis TaxID=189425 RepID=UPI002DB8D629|nr:glycosyltransferase [Paenibacillus graminis]MEC0169776.1 glycosyltransferase [Paenibacillus graminis]
MILISVIMPVYNSEEYISMAIESILSQSFKDFELIIINDGSTDRSGDICDYYASIDNRIIVVHQKNKGISAARNKALDLCKGEYITFADNDDEFSNKLLEENYKIAKEYDADIVKYGISYYSVSGTKKTKVQIRNVEFLVLSGDQLKTSYMELKKKKLLVYVWDGLYKAELIKNRIFFNEEMKFGGEDIDFNLSLFPFVNKLAVNPTEHYIHYKRFSHSTAVKFNDNKLDAYLINAQLEYKMLNFLKFEKNVWIECLSIYIAQILFALTKIKSKSLNDKINFLENISKYDCFDIKYNYRILIEIWKENKKKAVILALYKMKHYHILYFFMSFLSTMTK